MCVCVCEGKNEAGKLSVSHMVPAGDVGGLHNTPGFSCIKSLIVIIIDLIIILIICVSLIMVILVVGV